MPVVRSLAPFRSLAPLFAALLLASCQKAATLPDESPLCERCHGGNGSAAPPRSARGETATTARGVGAHRKHLEGGALRGPIECRECHTVPASTPADNPGGHIGDGPRVTFGGALARANLPTGVEPQWDSPSAPGKCANVYCHGATLSGGGNKEPVWTVVDGSQTACSSCHGYPPATTRSGAAHPSSANCVLCHSETLADNATIDLAAGMHIDGQARAVVQGGCNTCHPYPPPNGVHQIHTSPGSAASGTYGNLKTGAGATAEAYDFGCGECHPTDQGAHLSHVSAVGVPDVVLLPPATPIAGDEVKRRNAPDAAYDPATGTCSGVYCHSSGQDADRGATPLYVQTPDWRSPPAGGLGCSGCHGNPPRYPSGGAGAPDANSHVGLTTFPVPPFAWEYGHFSGLPGSGGHAPKHGGGDAGSWGPVPQISAPITCQACHFDTVDATNVRAGGFFYFDSDGDFDLLPAGLPVGCAPGDASYPDCDRSTYVSWQKAQCATCHTGTDVGHGKALPVLHVNGTRDVAFDRRLALPAGSVPAHMPPLATTDPIFPFYMTSVPPTSWPQLSAGAPACATTPQPSCDVEADVALRANSVDGTRPVLTLKLGHASYDPATKTCTSVACHLGRQYQIDNGLNSMTPLRWGEPYYSDGPQQAITCNSCHPM